MLRHWLATMCVAALLAGVSGCRQVQPPPVTVPTAVPHPTTFPMTLTDALGQTVTLPAPPQRIISLAPSLTEIVFALGLGDRIVGVTEFCKYPPEALKKEKIGGYVNASQEKIVSLRPDVVFATRGTPTGFMDGLRKNGIRVMAVDQTSYAQVVESLELMGRACGAAAKGQELGERLRRVRDDIEARTKTLPADQRPSALLVLSLEPLFVGGPGSFQHEIIEACGATDVSGLQKPFGALSEEAVVQADPRILIFPSNDNGRVVTMDDQLKRLQASPVWRNVSAVKHNGIIIIDVDHISVPGPRLELGFRELARALHPNLFTP
jgi:iron complex transport system substrate-binding protein